MIRVAMIAPAVRGAMQYHITALIQHINQEDVNFTLFVPQYFKPSFPCVHRYPLTQANWMKMACYLNPYWAYLRFIEIKRIQPDVVHIFNSEGYPNVILWSRWIRRKLSIPLIVSLHDPEPHPGTLIGWLNHRLGKLTTREAHAVHIFSEHFRPAVYNLGFVSENIYVIPLVTDVSEFTQYRLSTISREPMVLFFGRLEKYKGINILLESALTLRSKYRFVIAGPGKIPSKLLRIIQSNPDLFELRNYYLPEKEVAELFQRASVCVMPYIQGTQSSIPWLAAAFGVPLVATDVGGIASQCREIGGIVVPPKDPQALARGIIEASQIETKLPSHWEPKNIADQYVAMYHSVYMSYILNRCKI